MNPSLRTLCKSALAAIATVALALPAFAQAGAPTSAPTLTPAHDAKAPGAPTGSPAFTPVSEAGPRMPPTMPYHGGPSPMTPQSVTLPKYLEGIITLEELQAYIKFQQDVNESPQSKELLAQIIALRKQAQQLQAELSKYRMKALADNVEMKAIFDKMQQAMRMHSPMPPRAAPGMPSGMTAAPIAHPAVPVAPTQTPPAPKS